MNKKIKIIVSIFAFTVLMVSLSITASAIPPEPKNGPPSPVLEQNLDADGNIKVHEQGVVDVNVTNSSSEVTGSVDVNNFPDVQAVEVTNIPYTQDVEVTNLPATQDVNIVGGSMDASISPVTKYHHEGVLLDTRSESERFEFDTINATTIITTSFDDTEMRVWFYSPMHDASEALFIISDLAGRQDTHTISFTHPIPINGFQIFCKNEGDKCPISVTVLGY